MSTTTPSTDEQMAINQATKSGIPYLDAQVIAAPPDITTLMSFEQQEQYHIVPLVYGAETKALEFGVTPSTDLKNLPVIAQALEGHQVTFKTISETGYTVLRNQAYIASFAPELRGDFAAFTPRLATAPPKTAFSLVAQLAYLLRASDIHIEPEASAARVRFRIDGTLHPITTVPNESYKVFLADLQTKANMTWGSDTPQSGRITLELSDLEGQPHAVDMRIETIPAFHGEEIVVRIFATDPAVLRLEGRGLSTPQLAVLRDIIHKPNGMVLAVGPTGSGKTSTLYAVLNELNSPETKIITLEDPVEYDITGVTQLPIHSEDKELFVEKLRAVLREDPNIIMIGEIRDMDTARTALQASLTGHLVLATFHASSAATAISRLIDMVDENALLASSVRLINAQRLVRKVCNACQKPVELDTVTKQKMIKAFQTLAEAERPNLEEAHLVVGQGCAVCNGLGYRDRLPLTEQLVMSSELEELISSHTDVTAQAVQELAEKLGMRTLLQDGLIKALAGQTTLEEIERVLEF